MLRFLSKQRYLIILLTISFIAHWYVFFDHSILNAGDWVYHYQSEFSNFLNYNIYYSFSELGRVASFANNWVFYLGFYFLGLMGFSWDFGTRILFLVPMVFLVPLFSYLLFQKIFKNDRLAFFAASLYTFNTFFLKLHLDFITYGFLWWVLPALFLILLYYLEKQELRFLILAALLTFIGFAFENRIMLLVIGFLVFFQITHILLGEGIPANRLKMNIKFLAAYALGIVPHAFWILPFMSGLSSAVLGAASPTPFVPYQDMIDALTLHQYMWTDNIIASSFNKQPAELQHFIVPFLVFLGLFGFFRNRDNKNGKLLFELFFTVSLICFLFLAKQQLPPAGWVYEWLFYHMPLFNLYRVSDKFYILTAISLSFFFAIGLFVLYKNLQRFNKKMALVVAGLLLFFSTFFNIQHFVDQKIGYMTKGTDIQQDYITTASFLNNDPNYSRVLWIPAKQRFSYGNEIHPLLQGTTMLDKYAVINQSLFTGEDEWNERFNQLFTSSFLEKYSNIFTVRYVIVLPPTTITERLNKYIAYPQLDVFRHYGGREDPNIRQWYIDQLDALPYLKRIDIGTKELVVYENEGYLPYIRAMAMPNQYDSFGLLNNKYAFSSNMLERPFDFFVSTTTAAFPAVHTRLLFEDITPQSLSGNTMTARLDHTGDRRLYLPPTTQLTQGNDGSFTLTPSSDTSTQFLLDTGGYARKTLALTTPTTLQYEAAKPFTNIVQNPSFEDGFWQTEVGDCNAYDDTPILAMSTTSTAHRGTAALELSATRHTACTNQKVSVEGGHHYLFSFAYQSSDAKEAGYYIGYTIMTPDGSTTTSMSEKISIKDDQWQAFRKIIDVPNDAVSAAIYFYSFAKDDTTPIVTRYDDVNLIELPDDIFDYWLVARPDTAFVEPRDVTFDIVSPTKKLIHIKGATTPFYLAMSESYHPQWQLEMNNEKVNGTLRSWIPWITPDRIPDEMHFELDGFLNGWYVDIAALCANGQAACVKNSDGSYDMEMAVEFFPQRWFYVGLIISGTTLISCIGYLVYDTVRRRRKTKHDTSYAGQQ